MLIERWSVLKKSINIVDDSELSDISDLVIAASSIDKSAEIRYSPQIGEIVGAKALKTLAKSFEAVEAMAQCDSRGVSMSAVIQAYNASFLAARGYCMVMGFAPLDRDSDITIDSFPDDSSSRHSFGVFSTNIRLHRFRRWGHQEVWTLTERLIRTTKVPDELRSSRDWLTQAKLSDSSKLRNSFQYDDRRLSPISDFAYNDFPDVVRTSIFDRNAPSELSHQFFIAQHLLRICDFVIDKANIKRLLLKCACRRRVDTALNLSIKI